LHHCCLKKKKKEEEEEGKKKTPKPKKNTPPSNFKAESKIFWFTTYFHEVRLIDYLKPVNYYLVMVFNTNSLQQQNKQCVCFIFCQLTQFEHDLK